MVAIRKCDVTGAATNGRSELYFRIRAALKGETASSGGIAVDARVRFHAVAAVRSSGARGSRDTDTGFQVTSLSRVGQIRNARGSSKGLRCHEFALVVSVNGEVNLWKISRIFREEKVELCYRRWGSWKNRAVAISSEATNDSSTVHPVSWKMSPKCTYSIDRPKSICGVWAEVSKREEETGYHPWYLAESL